MTFSSIILKLMPFSYIETNPITGVQKVNFSLWEQLSDGDKIITVVEVFLIFIFVLASFRLLLSWWRDRKQIMFLANVLELHRDKIKDKYSDKHLDISSEYHELLEDINSHNNDLQKLWKEYDESLIKKYDGETFIIRNSIDAEYFFNKNTMISHLGSKLFSAIPGILLGIGLLGTFTGLYFALIQLDMHSAEKLKESIEQLINMAGVKFAASIWGLGLSVVFTIFDKIFEFQLESKLERIQTIVNQVFIRQTAEQNLDEILVENSQQTKALNGLATSLTEKIAAEFNTTLIPKIEMMNQHFHQMPEHISTSISQTFKDPLNDLTDTVKNLTSNQAEQSTYVLENLLKEFISELKTAAGDQGSHLQAAAQHSQEVMEQTARQLQSTFESMQSVMSEQQTMNSARDEKILDDLNQIKYSQQEMINNLSNSVQDNISNISTQVNENISKLVETVQVSSKQYHENNQAREESLSNTVNSVLENIEASMVKQVADDERRNSAITLMLHNLNSQNRELMESISTNVSTQMNSLNINSEQLFAKLIGHFDNHIDRVKSSVDSILSNLKIEVQNIDTIMSSTSKQLVSLPVHLDKVGQSTDKLLSFSADLKESTTRLMKFNDDLSLNQEKLNGFVQNLQDASGDLKQADTSFKETLHSSQQLLETMRTQFGDLAQQNSDTIETFGIKVDEFMNSYQKHVEKAINDTIIHQLDNAFAGFAHEMADAINTLSEAIDELREREIR